MNPNAEKLSQGDYIAQLACLKQQAEKLEARLRPIVLSMPERPSPANEHVDTVAAVEMWESYVTRLSMRTKLASAVTVSEPAKPAKAAPKAETTTPETKAETQAEKPKTATEQLLARHGVKTIGDLSAARKGKPNTVRKITGLLSQEHEPRHYHPPRHGRARTGEARPGPRTASRSERGD